MSKTINLKNNENQLDFIKSVKNGAIIPIYILDDINAKEHNMGPASEIWLHHSLKKLNKQMNNNLLISRGNPENILLEICKLEKIKKEERRSQNFFIRKII